MKRPQVYEQCTHINKVPSKDPEIYYSDLKEEDCILLPTNVADTYTNENSILNSTYESAYKGDISTYAMDTAFDTKRPKKMRKHKFTPILRIAYYGRKRLTVGKRHFVFSVIEYSTGASLGSS